MKKIFLIAALASVVMTSCSNDEVMELQQNEIKFNVLADNASRAESVYCNNNLPESFEVWAYDAEDASIYLNENVTKSADGTYKTDDTRYWPKDMSLNFLATNIYNLEYTKDNISLSGGAAPSGWYMPGTDVSKQKDVIYAIAKDQNITNAKNGVNLNFRHALSQIVFSAKNTNKNLYIEVSQVRVGGVDPRGLFLVKNESTAEKFENHNQNTSNDELAGVGFWRTNGSLSNEENDYITDTYYQELVAGEASVALTGVITADKEYDYNTMLLLPQETSAWDPTKGGINTGNDRGAFIGVNCKIWNIAGSVFNEDTDKLLHEGWALIPVAVNWKPGKKYHYTFVFGEGNGGLTDDEIPEPVLTPITYNVTVDDFQAGETFDKEMDTNK